MKLYHGRERRRRRKRRSVNVLAEGHSVATEPFYDLFYIHLRVDGGSIQTGSISYVLSSYCRDDALTRRDGPGDGWFGEDGGFLRILLAMRRRPACSGYFCHLLAQHLHMSDTPPSFRISW